MSTDISAMSSRPTPPRYPRKPFLGYMLLDEQSWGQLQKAVFAEFIMTAAFLFLAIGIVVSDCPTKAEGEGLGGAHEFSDMPRGSCFLESTTLLNIALGFGIAIFACIYVAAPFSGGHLNPAVTLAQMLMQKVSILKGLLYIVFQLLGACVGTALLYAINENGFKIAVGGANRLHSGVKRGTAFVYELILTTILVLVATVVSDLHGPAHVPTLAPLAVGLTVFLANMVAIPIDGCSTNPARSFGPAAVSHTWSDHWIFWVGPFAGAVAAVLLYEAFFRTATKHTVSFKPSV